MKKPTHKAIHIAKSLEKANRTNQNLSISISLPTPCRMKENNKSPTMAKKHRGFGGKLVVLSFG
jgi:hypothetical protein